MSILKPMSTLTSVMRGIILPFQVVSLWVKKIGKIKIPPWVRYGMHLILLGVLVAVLVFLNLRLEWYRQIDAPGWVKYTWPGLVALLIYAAIRLLMYIISQIPTKEVEFPDIEEALEQGISAIAANGINIRDVPLFLVVGTTAAEERSFVESSIIGREIRVNDPALPIHWYGDAKAVWVTLPRVSAVAAQVDQSQAAGRGRAPEVPTYDASATFGGSEGSRFDTLGAGAARYATNPGLAPSPSAPLVEGYHAPAKKLDADERDRIANRIAFFCRKLKEVRYPVCTANGVMLAVPYSWTTSPGLSQLADMVKIDMQGLQDHLGVKCMSVVVFTGIEQFPEFQSYIKRLDRAQVERRCGCGYPSLITPETVDVEDTHRWVVQYFERQVFELFNRKLGDSANGDLFRLLDKIRKGRANFVRIIKSAFPDDVKEPFYLAGVYFASLEPSEAVRLPFFDGLLARLAREHDDVIGWADSSVREDRQMSVLARWILGAAAALVILDALIILSLFVDIGFG